MKIIKFAVLLLSGLICLTACSNDEPESSNITSAEVEISKPEQSSEVSESEETFSEEESTSSEDITSSEASSEHSEEEKPSAKAYDELILVNPTHYIPDDYEPNLVTVQGKYKMDEKAAQHAIDLVAAAKEAGFDMQLCSAYRTVAKSEELYNRKVNEYLQYGYDEKTAKTEAAKWVAPPGTSEHHTGLAMDIVSSDYWSYYSDLEHEFENFDSFRWLYEHCAEFGFVLRYPKDKQDITGITYEPWHYRYVGVENAKYIMENGLCLEEYLEQK